MVSLDGWHMNGYHSGIISPVPSEKSSGHLRRDCPIQAPAPCVGKNALGDFLVPQLWFNQLEIRFHGFRAVVGAEVETHRDTGVEAYKEVFHLQQSLETISLHIG